MKAIRFHQHGGSDVLRYEDAPDKVPAPGRAIVRVRACSLNHLDLWQRRGLERVRIPLPHISGADVAGEVVDAGSGAAGSRRLPGASAGRAENSTSGDDLTMPLRLGFLGGRERITSASGHSATAVANQRLRGWERLRCSFQTDAARWPHRAVDPT